MLTFVQIKENIDPDLHLFLADEEDLLVGIFRCEARHGSHFLISQSSEHINSVFEGEELSDNVELFVRRLHLFSISRKTLEQ